MSVEKREKDMAGMLFQMISTVRYISLGPQMKRSCVPAVARKRNVWAMKKRRF